MNGHCQGMGIVIGGKEHITDADMRKCCWPGYLTVMYETPVVGEMSVLNLKRHNDYALWLNVNYMTDCHLKSECLAKHRSKCGRLGKLFLDE